MKQVRKHKPRTAQNTIILVGIFHHPVKGLVLYQIKRGRKVGKLQIPGRRLKKEYDSRLANERQFFERQIISVVFTEQTGRYCYAKTAFVEFSADQKSLRAFLIEIGDGDQIDEVEFLDPSFIFIPANQDEIKTDQDILPEDKAILLYYLAHQEEIKNRKDNPFIPVMAVAS